jgi:hypothetical protein
LIKPIPDFSHRFHIHFIIPRGRFNKKITVPGCDR